MKYKNDESVYAFYKNEKSNSASTLKNNKGSLSE
jgi:hypothetical protein